MNQSWNLTFILDQILTSAQVTHVRTGEPAPIVWTDTTAAAYRDLKEHGVKKISL